MLKKIKFFVLSIFFIHCVFFSITASAAKYWLIDNVQPLQWTTDFSAGCTQAIDIYFKNRREINPPKRFNDPATEYCSAEEDLTYLVRVFLRTSLICAAGYKPSQTETCESSTNFYMSKNDFYKAKIFNPKACSNESSNSQSPSIYTTNPINTTDGNKTRLENDFNAPGISPLKFTRYYNSFKKADSDIGYNWKHNYTASLTANIHKKSVPYVSGDSNFSAQYSTAQAACESGWNNIKSQFTQSDLINSTARYNGTACSIRNGTSTLGSIAVRSSGGASPNPPKDTIVIERANGNTIVFTLVNSAWTAPSNTDVSLVQTSTGYTLTTAQDTVEQYNLKGQLISSTDRKGINQTLMYNATTGLLETVTDSFGQSLGFSYAGTKLISVTLPDTSQLIYRYDTNNNFVSVVREDNTVKTYVYEDVRFPNALTGIIDENNQRYMTFTYDTQGRAITSELAGGVEKVTVNYIDNNTSTVTDALGQLRTYRFTTINGEKRLTDIEGAPCATCGGQSTKTTYDANGYVASSTDFNGNITTYINNARGLPTTRKEAAGTTDERVITTLWHPTYSLPVKITQANNITGFSYDAKGNVLTKTQTDTTNNTTRTWVYTYNNYGQVLTVDGTRTDVTDITTYTYNVKGNLTTATNALGHATTITAYDLRNRPLTLIDANGLTTLLGYDARGRLTSRTVTGNGNNLVTTFAYDGVGNLKTITLPDAQVLNYTYDAAHRLIAMSDQLGNRIDYTLNKLGKRLSEKVTDASNALVRTRTQVYNLLNQLTQSIGAQSQTTNYSYDANGNQTSITDAANQTTTTAFDALNRVIAATDPLAGVSNYQYDAQGNLSSVKDKNGSITTYVYDGFGNRLTQTSPDTGTTSYQYDTAANVIAATDAKGQTTLYGYDALNRLTQTQYADGRIVTYAYDQGLNAIGRLTQIQNTAATGESSAISYVYDVFARLTQKTQTVNGLNLTTAYTYDTQGRVSQMTYPSGTVVTYGYLNGQLNSLSVDNKVVLSDIAYQAFGSVKSWNWGNGTLSSRGYDLDGQLTSQTLASETRTLRYDSVGNIKSINSTQVNQLFNYDVLNRLTAANDSVLNTGFNQTFAYDANGNRLNFSNGTTSEGYTYESISNRLTSLLGATTKTYQYDANGNIINDSTHTFNYDSRNRLVSLAYPQACPAGEATLCGTKTDDANYQFNALGQRIAKQTKNNVPDYAFLNTYYQQAADLARLQATTYTNQATALLTQAVANETQAPLLIQQALADRAQAQNLTQQADLLAVRQQSVQSAANRVYAQVASVQAKIVEPTTSFVQTLLNGVYKTLVTTLTTVADGIQAYADSLAQQITDLRTQATTLIAKATAAEQQAAALLVDATQFRTDAANLQTLAQQQTQIADNAQQKADNYQSQALANPKITTQTHFTYNERGQLMGEYDATGQPQQEMIYLGNLPIAVVKNNGMYYIHTDHLGTPRVITDTTNTPLWSWHSDPFGKTAANEDVDGDGVSFRFNLRFAGQYFDSETGLHYNYFRDYDPSTGRYVQSDPIGLGGGLNTYGYVYGNPIRWVDALGLFSPGAHDQILNNAFQNSLSQNDIRRLQQSSRDFDSRTQSGNQSHMHSMARNGQNTQDATRMIDQFINNTLDAARILANAGDRNGALDLLGEACHPIMDSSSPMHTDADGNPREWNPLWPFGHSPNDFIGNETVNDLTPAILEQQRLRLNEAYNRVFGGQ